MKNIIYLTRNGLLEPLGQSQILSYLVPLSKENKFFIISFEKQEDYKNSTHLKRIKEICKSNNIVWKPLVYKNGNRKLGILKGFLDQIKTCVSIIKKEKINLIHARSYFPSFIALFLNKIYKLPFIFDMRALWPEELVEAGRLKNSGFVWRIVKYLEKKCLNNSMAIVSLTENAVNYLDEEHQGIQLKNKTTVIPTCADLDRFVLKKRLANKERVILSCVGSMLTGWFKIDLLKLTLHYILDKYPNVSIEFLTRDNKEKLLNNLDLVNKYEDRLNFTSVLFKDMPKRLATHDGSIFFFTPSISKLGSAPTRMAELLGTGIPVFTNSGVGDVGSIIKKHQVGVLIEGENKELIETASDKFMSLILQKDIDFKCRETAEKLFSLESGVHKYKRIYDMVLLEK